MRRILAADALASRVEFGPRISTAGQTRKSLAAQSHQYIRDQVLRHERGAWTLNPTRTCAASRPR